MNEFELTPEEYILAMREVEAFECGIAMRQLMADVASLSKGLASELRQCARKGDVVGSANAEGRMTGMEIWSSQLQKIKNEGKRVLDEREEASGPR